MNKISFLFRYKGRKIHKVAAGMVVKKTGKKGTTKYENGEFYEIFQNNNIQSIAKIHFDIFDRGTLIRVVLNLNLKMFNNSV